MELRELGSLPLSVDYIEKHCSMDESNTLHGSSARVGAERLLQGHILPKRLCESLVPDR